jgi:hypothetical protein
MTPVRLPDLKCSRCTQPHDLTVYEDGSIRSSTHINCPKPVPGPPNPPRLLDKGKFWLVPTTCVECGAKGQAVTQMQGVVHKTVLCDECAVKEGKEQK